MSSINTHVGKMIRKYRKAANLTLQQLADAIHKSRATICKYENGDISMDIETLYEISQVLQGVCPAADRHRTGCRQKQITLLHTQPGKVRFSRQRCYIFIFMTAAITV